MAELYISELRKTYGNHTVLEFDEWDVKSGISWIKGGNGTGKTTLFKIIAGQIPFKGNVALNSVLLHRDPVTYRSMLSYAEAEPQYPTFITGNELLNYYIKIRKATRNSADALIEQFELGEFMNNKTESYSSGMLKKLSLICALVGDIQLYLLDEPLITIDTAAAKVLYAHIEMLKNKGCIVLLSSHQEVDQDVIQLTNTFIIRDKQLVLC